MRKLAVCFSIIIAAASTCGAAVGQVQGYVQVNPPSTQPGGFDTQTGKVASFTDTGLASNQCVQTGSGGLLTTTGAQCGTGGGGGFSALGVNNFGVSITSPTAQINFIGPLSVTATGSTATVTLSQISLSTGVTGSLPAASIAAGRLGSAVIASSLAVNSVYPASASAGTYPNVLLPAPNINSGYLGSTVIGSSLAPSSVGVPQFNFTGTASSSTYARGDGTWSAAGIGTITGVTAGPGLSGGGTSGTVTLIAAGVSLSTQTTGILPVANGGTGTSTPNLLNGSNIIITGTWPNQTINATVGGGGGPPNTVNPSAQYSIPFYSASGSSTTLSGNANFSYNQTTVTVIGALVASTITATGLINSYGTISIDSGTSLILYSPSNNGSAFMNNPGTGGQTSQLFVDATDGMGINSAPINGIDLFLSPGTGHPANTSYANFAVQGSSANAAITYSGFTSTNNVNLSTLWSLPRKDGTSGQALITDGSTHLLFSSISGGGGNATLPLPGGATNYINNTTSIQTATITVSGTIDTETSYQLGGSKLLHTGTSSANANTFLGISDGTTAAGFFSTTCAGNNACNHLASGASFNSCFGTEACKAITSGTENECFGYDSCLALTTGNNNAAFGFNAGKALTTGLDNTCLGDDACDLMTTGTSNVVIGDVAGADLTSGVRNTCIGGDSNAFQPCQGVVTGSSNTMVGSGSGGSQYASLNHAESGNTFIGYQGGMKVGVNYGIGIGYQPLVSSSNTAVIGGGLGAFNEENLIVSSITTNYINNKYALATGSMTGAGLTSCSGGSSAVTWNSATNLFGCNTISSGGGGSSSLAVGTGTTSGWTAVITSSPTAVILFDSAFFTSVLQGGSTNFITIPSTINLQAARIGINKSGAFSGGVDGTGIFNSDTGMQAPWFTSVNALTPAFAATSSGSNFGLFENRSSISWDLGYGPSKTSLGTSVFRWDSSQNLTAASWNSSTSSFTAAGTNGSLFTGATTGPAITVSSAPTGIALVSVSSTPASIPSDFVITISSQNGTPVFGVQYGGHVISSGTTPSMGTCGTSPSVVGTDTAGAITVGSGIVTSCTLNFANSWANVPVCVETDNSTAITGDITTTTTSSITFGFSASLGGGIVNFICFGQKG